MERNTTTTIGNYEANSVLLSQASDVNLSRILFELPLGTILATVLATYDNCDSYAGMQYADRPEFFEVYESLRRLALEAVKVDAERSLDGEEDPAASGVCRHGRQQHDECSDCNGWKAEGCEVEIR